VIGDSSPTDRWWETHQAILDAIAERSPSDYRLAGGLALHMGISLDEARDRLSEYADAAGRAQKVIKQLLTAS
jgi:DNA-binding FadR family transcriptional regulator